MSSRRGNCSRPTEGHLRLTDLEPDRGKRVAVDLFFRLLADTHGPRAAAIILSGADADGAGIRRIKERGGLTIAQDRDEAEHRGMPQADRALAKGRASDERWHMRKDGSRLWASGVMMLLRDRRGEAIGFVKIFRDRTAELRAKEAPENGTQGNRARPCRCRSCQQGEGSNSSAFSLTSCARHSHRCSCRRKHFRAARTCRQSPLRHWR
jgi:hypothetical protein